MKTLFLATVVAVTSVLFSGVLLDLPPVPVAQAVFPSDSGASTPAPLNNYFTSPPRVVSAPVNYNYEQPMSGGSVPGWTTTGTPSEPAGGQSGNYLSLNGGNAYSTDPFTVIAAGTVWTYYRKGDSFAFDIAVGTGTPSWVQKEFEFSGSANWQKRTVDLTPYVSQAIRVRYRTFGGVVGFDEGAGREEVPNWTTTGLPVHLENLPVIAAVASTNADSTLCKSGSSAGQTGNAVLLAGTATSTIKSNPFTVLDGKRLYFRFDAVFQPAFNITLYTQDGQGNYTVPHSLVTGSGPSFPDPAILFMACDVSAWAGFSAEISISHSGGGSLTVYVGGTTDPISFDGQSKDPVSFSTGALSHGHTDIAMPGRGIPLEFTRNYSSSGALTQGPLGWGWTHNYDSSLAAFTDGSVQVRYPGGGSAFFTLSGGNFLPPRGVYDSLVQSGATYTLTTPSQIAYFYDSSGRLASISDRNANLTSLHYDADGLDYVEDPSGRVLNFIIDAGAKRITQITDPSLTPNRTVGYGYDAGTGDLTTVTDVRGGVTTFTYSSHRLTSIKNANQQLQVVNLYDSANRVVEQAGASGGAALTFTSNGLSDLSKTFVTNALVGNTVVSGGSSGTVSTNTATTVTLSSNWSNGTPAAGALYYVVTGAIVASGSGGNVSFSSNGLADTGQTFGSLTGYLVIAGPSSGMVASNTATAVTLASPANWNNAIPTGGAGGAKYWIAIGSIVSSGGGVSCFYYATPPLTTSANCPGLAPGTFPLNLGRTYVVDPRGNVELHSFDTRFRETGIRQYTATDQLETVYTYESGVPSSCSTPAADNGNICSVTDPLNHTTSFAYDNRGNVLSTTDPLSHKWQYTYTALNDLATVTDPRLNVAPCIPSCVTTYSYGSPNAFTHNVLTSIADATPLHNVTSFSYNDPVNPGLVTSTLDPLSHQTSFTYDPRGLPHTVADHFGNTVTYDYDAAGRLSDVIDAMTPSRMTTFTYDAANHLRTVQDPYNGAGAKTIYAYDAVGNRNTVQNARGFVTQYGYDAGNRLATVTDALLPAHRVTTYGYDVNDNLVSMQDGRHQGTARSVKYLYDEVNRLRNIAYPDVHYATAFTYYKDGMRHTMTDTRGACCNPNPSDTTTYGYDAARRLTSVQTTFKAATQIVQYGYNEANDRTLVTYPDLKTVTYAYDELNRMSAVMPSWLGGLTQYTYDAAGRLQDATLPAATGLQAVYGFDAANRLTSVINKKSGVPISSYTYVPKPNGTRQSVTDINGMTTQYGYDTLDRLNSVAYPSPASTTTYGYDGVGNRLSMQVDANPAMTYTYDEADQLKTMTGVTGTNTYDKNGNLTNIGGSGTSNDTFFYDHENRLMRNGGCLGDVDNDGSVSILDLSAIAGHFGASEGAAAYDLTYNLDLDGSISVLDLSKASAVFGRNCFNTGENTGEGIYTYNGDGLRMRSRTMTAPKMNDDFVWDVGAGLPQILQDTRTPDGGAPSTTTYVYGLGLSSATDGSNVTSYYLSDGLGSTTELRSDSGVQTATYSYDVFGAPKPAVTSTNDFRFTGQQDDRNANRGLYYLRARHYDPTLGRFLERDPFDIGNRYAYAGDDPVNYSDPTGYCHVIPCFDTPSAPVPYFSPDLPSPGDLGLPDLEFNPDVAENWRRHVDWIRQRLNRREGPPQGPPKNTGLDPSRWTQPRCWEIPTLAGQLGCYTAWVAGLTWAAKTLGVDVILRDYFGDDRSGDKEGSGVAAP